MKGAQADDLAYRRELARRLRLHRRVQDLTQQQIADRAGLSRSFIAAFETGEHGIDVASLRRIARALDLPMTGLVAEPGDAALTWPDTLTRESS